MGVRKSNKIGLTLRNFKIVDSFHIGTQTKFKVICLSCNCEQIKTWHSVVDEKSECSFCGNGRKKRNANGHYGEKLYLRYMQILRRTENKNMDSYKYYGERNIQMCDEWKNNFQSFYDWSMKNGYKDNLTIDRIDVNKGYSPDNCRWVDLKTQANNRRNNILKTYKGKTQTLGQWADEYNLPRYIVYNRNKYGWDIEKILNTPIKKK